MFKSFKFAILAICLIGVLVDATDPSTTVLRRNSRRFSISPKRAYDINWGACTLFNVRKTGVRRGSISQRMSNSRGVVLIE